MNLKLLYIVLFTACLPFAVLGQRNANIIAALDQVFNKAIFDSSYYSIKFGGSTFFVLRDGPIVPLLDSITQEDDVLELPNGNQVAFNSQGWMFMIDVQHYLKFIDIRKEDSLYVFIIDCVEFNGFTERVHCQKTLRFEKKGREWKFQRLGQER